MRSVLGEHLVGVYLYGSLVAGDFDEGVSDIDLLAATTHPVDTQDLLRLEVMHDAFARDHPRWEGRIEVGYVSLQALQTFKTETREIAVISPGEPLHHKDAGRDWLINWYFVRERGVTLLGPPPEEIIAAVSKDEFLEAVRKQADDWGEWVETVRGRKGHAYAVLTLCRALYTHRNGEQVSKQRAAAWARRELPEWAKLIDDALVWRASPNDKIGNPNMIVPEAVHFVRTVRAQVLGD